MNGENKSIVEIEYEGFNGCYIGYEGQPETPQYNYRKMLDYAKDKGLKLQELSQEEIEEFRI